MAVQKLKKKVRAHNKNTDKTSLMYRINQAYDMSQEPQERFKKPS